MRSSPKAWPITSGRFKLETFQSIVDLLFYCATLPKLYKSQAKAGLILGQNCVQFLGTGLSDFFFKNLFFKKKQCKYAMNIGVTQIRCPIKVFYNENVSFYVSAGCCLQFLK